MTGERHLFLDPAYRERREPQYFVDSSEARAGIVYQPEVYNVAAARARQLGCTRLIDIGCGSAEKLVAHRGEFELVGVDHGANISYCREQYPWATWIDWDLEREDRIPLGDLVDGACLVCCDVVEHLVDPLPLLRNVRAALERADLAVFSTPERDRMYGGRQLGPPTNPCHVREWNMAEFRQLLEWVGFEVAELELTPSDNVDRELATMLAVVR